MVSLCELVTVVADSITDTQFTFVISTNYNRQLHGLAHIVLDQLNKIKLLQILLIYTSIEYRQIRVNVKAHEKDSVVLGLLGTVLCIEST